MTLHRVTVVAFATLLVLSGIGSLMARQGLPASVPPVELSDETEETLPPVGGQVEALPEPEPTEARDADEATAAAQESILIPSEPVAPEAPVEVTAAAALVSVEGGGEDDDDDEGDDEGDDDSDDD
jgi:hypothetical protein